MKMKIYYVLGAGLVLGLMATTGRLAAQDGDNLFANPGFEDTKEVDLTSGYFNSAINQGVNLGDEMVVQIPVNFDQFSATKLFKVVSGKPGEDVHSGNNALLIDGGFYDRCTFPVQPGEIIEVHYFIKVPDSTGDSSVKVGVSFNLPGPDGVSLGMIEAKEPQVQVFPGSGWNEIIQEMVVPPLENINTAVFRFASTAPVLLDDVVVRLQH